MKSFVVHDKYLANCFDFFSGIKSFSQLYLIQLIFLFRQDGQTLVASMTFAQNKRALTRLLKLTKDKKYE